MTVPAFDGTNYGLLESLYAFLFKIHWLLENCWNWLTQPEDTNIELVIEKNARFANDKALYALCQALSPSKFTKISNCGTTLEAWKILETT
jgi:hypothetical protein